MTTNHNGSCKGKKKKITVSLVQCSAENECPAFASMICNNDKKKLSPKNDSVVVS
jgi:hypothetical protein